MVVNSNLSAQDAAANLQDMLQAAKQNKSGTSSNALEAATTTATPAATQSTALFSPLDMLTDAGSDMSSTDADQLTAMLASTISGESAKAQASQANQIPQSVLNLLQ